LNLILHVLGFTILLLWLRRYYLKQNSTLGQVLIPAFICRAVGGLAYGWLYVVYYGEVGDSLNYFKNACRFADFALQNPTQYLSILFFDKFYTIEGLSGDLWEQPRYLWMVKLVSIFNLLSSNNYWLSGLYFSLLSFLGMLFLTTQITKYYPQTRFAAVLAFLFFPSVVFFSSGLTKESLAMTCIGFSVGYFLKLIHQKPSFTTIISALVVWFASAWVLWQVKFYYLAIFAWVMLCYAVTISLLQQKFIQKKTSHPLLQLSLIIFLLGFSVFLLGFIIDFDAWFLLGIVYNHNSTYIHSESSDLIHYSVFGRQGFITLNANWTSISCNFPLAIGSALFRPFLWESGGNLFKMLIGIENLLTLFLTCFALLHTFKLLNVSGQDQYRPLLLFSISLAMIFALGGVLAFASPNFGGLIRYRIAFYPFFIYWILIPMTNHSQIKRLLMKIPFTQSLI
jgi:hypothetical protein